jgi:hypothetical protein
MKERGIDVIDSRRPSRAAQLCISAFPGLRPGLFSTRPSGTNRPQAFSKPARGICSGNKNIHAIALSHYQISVGLVRFPATMKFWGWMQC